MSYTIKVQQSIIEKSKDQNTVEISKMCYFLPQRFLDKSKNRYSNNSICGQMEKMYPSNHSRKLHGARDHSRMMSRK